MDKTSSPAAITPDEESPIEQVRLTVDNTDDPSIPVWTFRMWFLGILSCTLLSFLNQFFSYRTEPLVVTPISMQVASLPLGHFMARVLPLSKFRVPWVGECSLNPGPFNMKEHVLISIFANAGSAFGNGSALSVSIVNVIKAFYHRYISFVAAWLLIITTQVLGYGWAGLMRKFVVEPAHMWWPSTLVQVSLFRNNKTCYPSTPAATIFATAGSTQRHLQLFTDASRYVCSFILVAVLLPMPAVHRILPAIFHHCTKYSVPPTSLPVTLHCRVQVLILPILDFTVNTSTTLALSPWSSSSKDRLLSNI